MNLDMEVLEAVEAPDLNWWQGALVVAGAFVVGVAAGAAAAAIIT